MRFLRFIVASLLVGLRIWTPRRGNEWLRPAADDFEDLDGPDGPHGRPTV